MAFASQLQRPGTGPLARPGWCQNQPSGHTVEHAGDSLWKPHRPLPGCPIRQTSKWRCQALAPCSRACQRRQRHIQPQHRWPGTGCSISKLYAQQQLASWICRAGFEDEAMFADDYGLLSDTVEVMAASCCPFPCSRWPQHACQRVQHANLYACMSEHAAGPLYLVATAGAGAGQ